MTYSFERRTYPRFQGLFYRRFDLPLSQLPAPPLMDALPGRAQPPLGYICIAEGNVRLFVPDPVRSPLIAAAFARVAKGTHFQRVWRMAVAYGLAGRSGCRISASGLLHILQNPAYMGLLRYGQELYVGGLEPLISEGTFKSAVRELDGQIARSHAEYRQREERKNSYLVRAKELERDARQKKLHGEEGFKKYNELNLPS